MKKIILSAFLLITGLSYSQTVYEVEPGTKGNEIVITLSNISQIENAENVSVDLIKTSSSINFKNKRQSIEKIEANKETDISFIFDIESNAEINKKDTIAFMISAKNGMTLSKSFIISYAAPKEFKLEQNYPNPFNPSTKIKYSISSPQLTVLKVYDVLGKEIATLVNRQQQPGNYEIDFR